MMTTPREAIARAIYPEMWDGRWPDAKAEAAAQRDAISDAEMVITALREAGLRIVPEKMTRDMERACMRAIWDRDALSLKAIWDAAISAYEDGK